tara:strand:- start:105 stop:980 length:876 start_codon:yes stop_codon:yes gene_type:complete
MINQQIMVYSVPRTGSTLIWQCLAKIFTQVLKAHRNRVWDYSIHNGKELRISTRKKGAALDYSCPCVITERDLMDTFLSQWRNDNPQMEAFFHDWLRTAYGDSTPRTVRYPIKEYGGWTHKNDESQVLDMEKFKEACDSQTEKSYVHGQFKPGPLAIRSVREIALTFRKHLEDLEKVKKEYGGPTLVLEYEKFVDDYDYIFSNFEEFFDIEISEETKTEIKDATNRSTNKTVQEQLKGVQAHDTETHIHGGHIFTGEVGWSRKVLGEKNLARMETLLTCDIADILDIDLGE